MKKLFFVAVGLVGLVSVKAQEKTLQPQFGIKTQLNVSSFMGDDVKDDNFKLGWSEGVYLHVPITQTFAIQPEVNYSRIGAKYKNELVDAQNVNTTYSNTTTLDYIQVPVMFQFYLGNGRFNLELGPQIGFNTYASNKAKYVTNIAGQSIERETKSDISENIEKVDFGAVGGVGYNITDHVNVNARYYLGLNDTFKNQSDFDAKNQSFSFGVGYSF